MRKVRPGQIPEAALVGALWSYAASVLYPARMLKRIGASIVGFFAHSLFDVSYYDYRILLMFWIVIGLAACSPRLLTRST